MKKKKKSQLEEYHSGKTTDLRNVIAEIQKVDQETADLSAVVEEAQRIDQKRHDRKSVFTCRLLFSSVMDKVFLLLLFMFFLALTFVNFRGNIFSATYGFWIRFLRELGILVIIFISSLFCNWLYKCMIQTMLCVTSKSIYAEFFLPLWRKEVSIPLKHVTSVSAISFFWIFRVIIIHRYSQFPLVFFTWNHQLFKEKVDELLGNDIIDYNGASHKTIFRKKYLSIFKWIMIVFIFSIIVLGIIHFFGYVFSTEKQISGIYIKGNQKIELKVNGSCYLRLLNIMDLKKCSWKYDEDQHTIRIRYSFRKKNYYGELYDTKDMIDVGYKDQVLIYNGVEYKKR